MTLKATITRLLAVIIALGLTAASQCKPPYMARTWHNAEPSLNELSKIEIVYNCGEKPIRAYDPLSAALWIIKAHVRCARTDCTWGRARGQSLKDGGIEATFSTFSAIRQMKLKHEGGLLKANLSIYYRDRKRPAEHLEYYLHPDQ